MATRIDGKALAAKVKAQVAEKAAKLPRQPGLAVVLVGEDPASQVYVRGKEADCGECGIRSFPYRLPTETTRRELLDLIEKLNRDPAVDGILVQLPLPEPLEEAAVILSTHLIADVERILDEVIFVNQGQVLFQSTVDAIREEKGKSVDTLFREVYKC